jgi:small subunit ribosomal protein S14
MKSLVYKDNLYRKSFFLEEKNLKLERSIKKNSFIFDFQKSFLFIHKNFKINISDTCLKNRCLLTGRGNSINRIYRISRIQFRKLGQEGFINGLKKSSW